MSPESVYGAAWGTTATVVQHVVAVVCEAAGWLPPTAVGEAARELGSERGRGSVRPHEAFFNGSLILATDDDKAREEQRYRRLLDRTTVSWINNCGTPEDMTDNFISTVMK